MQKKGERLKPAEAERLRQLKQQLQHNAQELYTRLTAWQTVQVAWHSSRPHAIDYLPLICDDFFELHGDRVYGENAS